MNDFRRDFPIFETRFDPERIIYADSAATSLKPRVVQDAVSGHYNWTTSNVMRGNSLLAEEASLAFTKVRHDVARFLDCQHDEIVFTYNATDAINRVCHGLSLDPEDEVLVSMLEHHSNMVPWTQRCRTRMIPTDDSGTIDLEFLERSITQRTKLIAVTHLSNVTGNFQPIKEIVKIAERHGILTLLDASQSVSHTPLKVRDIGCTFLCFSAHKMFGPSGVGVLYGKRAYLEQLSPQSYGGGMVKSYSPDNGVHLADGPYRHESGTPNIEGILGLGAAVNYVEAHLQEILAQNRLLEERIRARFSEVPNVKILFPFTSERIPLITFAMPHLSMDAHFIARILGDTHRIALTSGVQCASLLYQSIGCTGGIRASFHMYNTIAEIDLVADALIRISCI